MCDQAGVRLSKAHNTRFIPGPEQCLLGQRDSQYFKSFDFQAKSAHVTGLTLSFLFFFSFSFCASQALHKSPIFYAANRKQLDLCQGLVGKETPLYKYLSILTQDNILH